MDREYIKITIPDALPDRISDLKELDNEFWKKLVFHHLLTFYDNFNRNDLKEKIETERKKEYPQLENTISLYIRRQLKNNKEFSKDFDIVGENRNDDVDFTGFYDITISNTYWSYNNSEKGKFHFECKNLKNNQDLINKYVYYNTYKKDSNKDNFDGGVFRYFNGKYAQNMDFGGMIGFVLEGNTLEIKNKIINKLNEKFYTSPEGDLLQIEDNQNNFTFNSYHNRRNKEFVLHHLLFNFSY